MLVYDYDEEEGEPRDGDEDMMPEGGDEDTDSRQSIQYSAHVRCLAIAKCSKEKLASVIKAAFTRANF